MTGEQAASALRAVAGVKSVTVKQKKNKPPQLRIRFDDGGIDLGPMKATAETVFSDKGLIEVKLRTDECASAAVPKGKTLIEALKTKFGNGRSERVVDVTGQPMGQQFAFANEITRVQLTIEGYNPAIRGSSAPGSGAVGDLADVFGAIATNSALAACPVDQGGKIRMTLSYVSQIAFRAEPAAFDVEKERIRKKAADGL